MNKLEVAKICAERLGCWGAELTKQHATPVLLLGVGQDDQRGELNVLVCEEVEDKVLKLMVTAIFQQVVLDKECRLG